eukprot:6174443-Pleurochrysis_carterae.AAC.1
MHWDSALAATRPRERSTRTHCHRGGRLTEEKGVEKSEGTEGKGGNTVKRRREEASVGVRVCARVWNRGETVNEAK